jgi:hypothetical protein
MLNEVNRLINATEVIKKKETTAVSGITRFQRDRELDKQEYDALNEHTNIAEELLESIGFDVPKENRDKLEEEWKIFVENCRKYRIVEDNRRLLTEEEEVDAYADIIVFAIGAIMKLGYDPELALQQTAKEINSREGKMVNGKFEKYLDEESKSKWYKANYSKAKVK